MNLSRSHQLVCVLLVAALAAGCTGDDAGPDGTTTAKQSVTPGGALSLDLPGVAHLSAPVGTFATPGTLRVEVVAPAGVAVVAAQPGARVTGSGIKVTLSGTSLTGPVRVSFPKQPAVAAGQMAVALHAPSDGAGPATEIIPADSVSGGTVVEATSFSSWWPATLDVRTMFSGFVDSATDALLARTDPDPCPADSKSKRVAWADLKKATTLEHSCLWLNPDKKGRPRAEVRLKSNRRFYTWLSVPSGYDYLWRGGDDGAVLQQMLSKLWHYDRGTTVLQPGGLPMSAGYRRPEQDRRAVFTAYTDWRSSVQSTLGAVIGLGGELIDQMTITLLMLECSHEIPSKATDAGGMWKLFKCVVTTALSELDKPDKALHAAMQKYGEAAYTEEAEKSLGKATNRLRLLGRAMHVIGLAEVVRDIWVQLPDNFSQMGSDRPGDLVLKLNGTVPECPTRAAALKIIDTWVRQDDYRAERVTYLKCSGAWVVTHATVIQPGRPETEDGNVYPLHAVGGRWVAVNLSGPCERHEIPADIYESTCLVD